jgi:hypothetical protein
LMFIFCCALGQSRTADAEFRKLLLYPTELQGQVIVS